MPEDAGVTPMASILVEKRRVISELPNVRNLIEPALARTAALQASPEQIAEMQAIFKAGKRRRSVEAS
jgi:DNA-binding FadR family transcriptional regulator